MQQRDEISPRITLRPLSPELCGDYLAFFESAAFSDNPQWSTCYCFFNQAPHHCEAWDERTGVQNRAAIVELLERGELRGWLAYDGERVVGWCNANHRERYTTLDQYGSAEGNLGAVTCFLVSPEYRGRGVARRLLDAACEGLRAEGRDGVEGYPRTVAESAAANYHGPLEMYLAAGFTPVREVGAVTVVRREFV